MCQRGVATYPPAMWDEIRKVYPLPPPLLPPWAKLTPQMKIAFLWHQTKYNFLLFLNFCQPAKGSFWKKCSKLQSSAKTWEYQTSKLSLPKSLKQIIIFKKSWRQEQLPPLWSGFQEEMMRTLGKSGWFVPCNHSTSKNPATITILKKYTEIS